MDPEHCSAANVSIGEVHANRTLALPRVVHRLVNDVLFYVSVQHRQNKTHYAMKILDKQKVRYFSLSCGFGTCKFSEDFICYRALFFLHFRARAVML
jgi:hypothetical protein